MAEQKIPVKLDAENILLDLEKYIRETTDITEFDCIKIFSAECIRSNLENFVALKELCASFIERITATTSIDLIYKQLSFVVAYMDAASMIRIPRFSKEDNKKIFVQLERLVKFYREDKQLDYLIFCLQAQIRFIENKKNYREKFWRKAMLLASAYYCKKDYFNAESIFAGVADDASLVQLTNAALYRKLSIVCSLYLASISQARGSFSDKNIYVNNAAELLATIPTAELESEIKAILSLSPRSLKDTEIWGNFKNKCEKILRRQVRNELEQAGCWDEINLNLD